MRRAPTSTGGRAAPVLAAILFLASCASPAGRGPTPVAAGQPFELAAGDAARLEDAALTVRFLEVGDDSRCPAGTQCPWAGNAAVRLRVETADDTAEITLNTTLEPRATSVAEHRIELLGVEPAATTAGAPAPGDYRVRLRISRA